MWYPLLDVHMILCVYVCVCVCVYCIICIVGCIFGDELARKTQCIYWSVQRHGDLCGIQQAPK